MNEKSEELESNKTKERKKERMNECYLFLWLRELRGGRLSEKKRQRKDMEERKEEDSEEGSQRGIGKTHSSHSHSHSHSLRKITGKKQRQHGVETRN